MKAALYLRVSTDEQAREGLSLPVQEQVCRSVAESAGAASCQVFRDDGYTGTTLKRPALQDLLTRLPRFDLLIVWKVDRLARKLRDRLALLDLCLEHGVRFRSATEPVDLDTVMGRAMIQMMGVFSEVEIGLLTERVVAAQQYRAEKVPLAMSPPPLGYKWTGKRSAWEIVPEEAERVRWMFGEYAAGTSLRAIVRNLNGAGAVGRRGGQYTHNAVKRVLLNPAYIGEYRWGQVRTGSHESLVPLQTWQAVQARLAAASHMRPPARARSLATLLRCGVCGGGVRRVFDDGQAYYICRRRKEYPVAQRHPGIWVRADRLETAIWARVEAILTDTSLLETIEAQSFGAGAETLADSLGRELRDVEQRLGRVREAYEAGAYDAATLAARSRPLEDRYQELLLRRETLAVSTGQAAMLARLRRAQPAEIVAAARRQDADLQLGLLHALFPLVTILSHSATFHYHAEIPPDTTCI